jgi:3',5'-cyclic AMP phosphodiesterase CpdA
VADLHLGYSWAQRRRGELGPLADSRTREKMPRACRELRPRRIVFLGDVVHAPRPCTPEREWIEQTLTELSQRAELIYVRGNHDRAFAREFSHLPVRMIESWAQGEVLAVYGDQLPSRLPEGHTLYCRPPASVDSGAAEFRKIWPPILGPKRSRHSWVFYNGLWSGCTKPMSAPRHSFGAAGSSGVLSVSLRAGS